MARSAQADKAKAEKPEKAFFGTTWILLQFLAMSCCGLASDPIAMLDGFNFGIVSQFCRRQVKLVRQTRQSASCVGHRSGAESRSEVFVEQLHASARQKSRRSQKRRRTKEPMQGSMQGSIADLCKTCTGKELQQELRTEGSRRRKAKRRTKHRSQTLPRCPLL